MPRIPVSQLGLNMTIRKQQFLLREKSLSTTRMGSPMMHVVLSDRTGAIHGVFFDVPTHVAGSLKPGGGVEVAGRVGEYKGQIQINLERIVPIELTHLEEFLPTARRPLEEMRQEFDALWASVENPSLSSLFAAIFDGETYRAFTQAPAAKINHHACVGGLLEHTLSVARLVLTACDLYPELDRDLVVTLAVLHDLGKIYAYDPISFDITEEGHLWTHLYRGASLVEQAIGALPDFDPELRLRVVHAILAHHGRLEWQSPVIPMTLEAIVLYQADHLDSSARGAIDKLERTTEDGGVFTDHSYMHETRLYRGAQKPAKPGQQTLW